MSGSRTRCQQAGKLFKFHPEVTCLADGAYTIVYTAEIDAPENRESAGDVLTATTVVRCGNHMGGMHAAGRETYRRNGKSPKRNR